MVIKNQEISRNVFLVIARWKMDSNSTKQPRNVLFFMGNALFHSPLHKHSWNFLSRQHFNTETNVKISLKRKQWCGGETMHILANISFHPPRAWAFREGHGFSGQKHSWSHHRRRETPHLGRCVLGSVSGAQEPNSTIMQNIMKTFHRAMKIRKYLRLSKNSRMFSPVPGSLDSSSKPCVSFFFLQREAVSVYFQWDTRTAQSPALKGPQTLSFSSSPTCCVTSGGSTTLSGPPSAPLITATDTVEKVVRGYS